MEEGVGAGEPPHIWCQKCHALMQFRSQFFRILASWGDDASSSPGFLRNAVCSGGNDPSLAACSPPAFRKLEAAFGLSFLIPQAPNWLALTWKKKNLLPPLELETLPQLRPVQSILQCLFFKGEHRDFDIQA